MKTSIAMVAGSLLLLAAGMPQAQSPSAPASAPTAAMAPSGSSASMSGHMRQMDEHMKHMQTLHDKLIAATTPESRQNVMDEQKKEMQAVMGSINQMHGGAMMGGMGGAAMGQKGKPLDAGMQMQMMQKRMDMMQMMMQSMMDQQGMMGPSKGG